MFYTAAPEILNMGEILPKYLLHDFQYTCKAYNACFLPPDKVRWMRVLGFCRSILVSITQILVKKRKKPQNVFHQESRVGPTSWRFSLKTAIGLQLANLRPLHGFSQYNTVDLLVPSQRADILTGIHSFLHIYSTCYVTCYIPQTPC